MSLQPSMTDINLQPYFAFGLTGMAVLGFVNRFRWSLEVASLALHIGFLIHKGRSM